MRVEVSHRETASALVNTADAIRANGGFVADDFLVREVDGHFSCAILDRIREAGRPLVSYPPRLTVPLSAITWSTSDDALEPVAGLGGLTTVQREFLDDWLTLVNVTGKLAQMRSLIPNLAVNDVSLRLHLAHAGYPDLAEPSGAATAHDALIRTHSLRMPPQKDGAGETWRLIPLKHLLNHHPSGAEQLLQPSLVTVSTSATSDEIETFENYGDLDAMQLLMLFGFVDDASPLVHSIPTAAVGSSLGCVRVIGRAPRNPRPGHLQNVPNLTPTTDGFQLGHLTLRQRNRESLVGYLAMALRARTGCSRRTAVMGAEDILDQLAQSNLDYYRRLDELAAPATGTDPILAMIAAVSRRQQERITAMWR